MPTDSTKRRKPKKPYPDFPLFAHATGRWAKKIRGRLVYFGPWDDPDGALKRYLDQRDNLHAGRTPRGDGDGLSVGALVDRYLTAKKLLVESREISPRTWEDNYKACGRIIGCFGKERLVTDLRPEDFEKLRADLGRTMSLRTLKTEMQRVRSIFKYAYDAVLVDRPVRFGPAFRNPSKQSLDRLRLENGPRMFEAEEICTMLETANFRLRAMVLLGINCGFGNTDCATLRVSALDTEDGWVSHPRPKTAVPRRCPLWNETIDALKFVLRKRLEPKSPENTDLVFLTQFGNPYVRLSGKQEHHDNLGYTFRELLVRLNLWKRGRTFYALRHTFRTVADEGGDQPAIDHITGHARDDMASVYRERISNERLKAVTDYVRQWLFGADEGGQDIDYEVTGRDKPTPK